ncbi:hypothetical protein [Rosistilla ulvae]|uniref:hypothetical protein n=1 Tax=Rosistilla ulvae TaxID=1930277 RepID=UPI0011A4F179|nr:hypothetical protein [Rosistilla ulvae]
MDPFFITCTTCSSRLKVRDESMIGQILACPNCQAMVMVAPPTEDQLTIGRQHDIDSQAITSETIHEELESEGTFPQAGPTDADESPADLSSPSDSQPSGSFGTMPPGDWKPSSYQGYRQIGMIALVSLIAIVSSVAIFGLFIQQSLTKEKEIAEVVDGSPDEVEASGQEVPGDGDSNAVEDPDADDPPPAADSEIADSAMSASDPPEDESSPTDPVPATDPAPAVQDAAGAVDPLTEVPEPVDGDGTPPPANSGPERIFADAGQPADQPEAAAMEELPESLQMFSSIFGQGLDLQQPDAKPQPTAFKPIRFEPPPELSGRYPTPQPAVDAQQRLQQSLGLNLQATTLYASVDTISQITSVPITFDIESLDSAGIELGTPVSGRYLNTTAGEAIRDVLAKAGCTLQQSAPGQMVVRASEPRISAFIEPALIITDLGEPTPVIALATQLAHLPDDPAELAVDPASDRVQVTGSPQAAWRVALALDALRISRDLPPKLPASHSGRWLVDGRPEELPRPDPGPIVLEGDLPRTVEHWLSQVAQTQNARVLIDWPSAWQYGLTPEFTLLPWPNHDSLASLEQELLAPFGLTIRDLGDGNWLVTSLHALAMSARTVVFSPPIPAETQFLERLTAGAGHETPETFPGVIDPVSQRLITRVSQFLQLQIAAELSATR